MSHARSATSSGYLVQNVSGGVVEWLAAGSERQGCHYSALIARTTACVNGAFLGVPAVVNAMFEMLAVDRRRVDVVLKCDVCSALAGAAAAAEKQRIARPVGTKVWRRDVTSEEERLSLEDI